MNCNKMIKTMRWFGPEDPVSLSFLRQAGCEGVVTALHHIPNGEVWSVKEINTRIKEIESAKLIWEVVESVPVHESIKTHKGDFHTYIENFKQTIMNLSVCGIKVITYNFMPIVDWTRTNLRYEMPDGSLSLSYKVEELAAFDLFILKRDNAETDYTETQIKKAKHWFDNSSSEQKSELQKNIIMGLPGSEESFTIENFRNALNNYKGIDEAQLRENLIYFLLEIIPIAVQCNIKMAIHPDDPPIPLFGLPRIVSNINHLQQIFELIPSFNNGLCFCSGSLGARRDNNLIEILTQFGERVNFIHLRNIISNKNGDFFESNHLTGDIDMFKIVKSIIEIIKQRNISIHMRPDHGLQMLDDLNKKTNPGYSAIGRMKGLAEIRGLELGILGNCS